MIPDMLDPSEHIPWDASEGAPKSAAAQLREELLEPSPQIPWDLLELVQTVPSVDRGRIFDQLLVQPEPVSRTAFRFKRGGISGAVTGFQEELRLSEVDNANATNSLSINRRHGARQDAVNGRSNFLPFQPGGVFNKTQTNQTLNQRNVQAEANFLHRNSDGLFDVPQGMSRGLNVGSGSSADGLAGLENDAADGSGDDAGDEADEDFAAENENGDFIASVGSHLSHEDASGHVQKHQKHESEIDEIHEIHEIDGYVPPEYRQLQAQASAEAEVKHTWAHVVDLNHQIENFSEIVPNMARTWPFELDTFQKEAVYHLEQGDSVFVAAHTSAGKTVVAEYAIAMAARNMTKTIYTSPIKALSNQKFRDFKETFKGMEIGLITGDVQINPDANCLIMTTEILRSMLYRGADLIRDVEFVIFDEVHYVNDIDRGVVWEEVIIMLPDHVKYILLSATVPNTYEFANWVGRTKQKDMYVISTPKRPVPLEIFVWAKDKLFKAIDANGVFSESEFRKHKELLAPDTKAAPPNVVMGTGSRKGPGGTARGGNRGGGGGRGGGGRGGGGGGRGGGGRGGTMRGGGSMQPKSFFARDGPNKSTWVNLVQYLNQNKLLPVVIFVFSKKRCEDYVDTLSGVNFCTARERSEIHMFIDRAVSRLKKEDRELPQILKIRDLLSRGIAVHHGGLLPIVKECIEILFSKSLIKVLFATETFAMGLNLPTRTVVFCELRKHDGRGFRNLHPGEFTQMAGRAGRRGLDTTGTVIVMSYKQPLQPADFKDVTMGKPTKLSSQFRLTYNMILNLLRIEALRVEEMIKHSFSENSTQTLLPEHKVKVEELSETLKNLTVEETPESKEFQDAFNIMKEYKELHTKIIIECHESTTAKYHVLKLGKLMLFEDEDEVLRFGILLKSDSFNKRFVFLTFNHGKEYEDASRATHMPYIPNKEYLTKNLKPIRYQGDLRVTSVPFENLQFASIYTSKVNIKALLNNEPEAVAEATQSFRMMLHHQSVLKEVSFNKTVQLSLHQLIAQKDELLEKFSKMSIYTKPNFAEVYSQLLKRNTIENKINSLNLLISDENLELLPDYEQRLKVLEQLDFIDKNQNVVLKGRVACEINSGWELVLTELILDNFLGDFEAEEIVALLSCFVYEGRTNDEEDPPLTPRLEKGKTRILQITERLLKIYTEHQVSLTSEEEEFLTRKRFALMNVVYEWARGLTFSEIMQISVESEGTIVRVITRLDEICRQVKNAALIVGDSMLHSKMSEAQERIKRDIVFCASLYI